MNKKINISDLKPGMYVQLPIAWRAHPFLRNSFIITSLKQIRKLEDYGIHEVLINEKLGLTPAQIVKPVEEPEKDFSQDYKIVAQKLQEVLTDKKLDPEKRAEAIHLRAADMMKNLWENPTSAKITLFKQSVAGIVDMILSENETNSHLLNITSYDYDTFVHSVNVGVLSVSLAKVIFSRGSGHDMHALGSGFFLHDIGKIKIDDAIINKPGKLTTKETEIMRKHPEMGYQLLKDTKQISNESRLIVLQHHERNNGKGYPSHLMGEEIHVYGRICSVADVYDALASKRSYKEQKTPFEALKIMKEEMLDHFHKEVFEKFVLLFK